MLNWLLEKSPGERENFDNCIIVKHLDGDISHFFKKREPNDLSGLPKSIKWIYEAYDGIDLFDTTFQICSFASPIEVDGSVVISTLTDLRKSLPVELKFPTKAIPFMLEGTQWVYAASLECDDIYSYDLDYDIIDSYDSVLDIIEGWLEQTKEEAGE